MNKKAKITIVSVLVLAVIALVAGYLRSHSIDVLQPRGVVGQKERQLMIIAGWLAAGVILPVFALTIFIVWKYRESNISTKKKYTPDWDHNSLIETIWWAIPCVIILVLAVITWRSSHELDPFKPLASHNKTVNIQVVALDWKWLFIYPDQHIASVNYVQFPTETPVHFEITSDTVMNSFWIPSLGGQIYAMPGMNTALNLMAAKPGNFNGSSANISGKGFAGMTFTARASSLNDFNSWVEKMKKMPNKLDETNYAKLASPSENMPPTYYSAVTSDLYDGIVMKYMMPGMDVNPQSTPNLAGAHS